MKVGAGFTITAADSAVDPPLPVQVMLYVVLTDGETRRDPEAPDGEKPVPLQDDALVDVHVSVDEAPGATLGGFVLNESSGALGDAAATLL